MVVSFEVIEHLFEDQIERFFSNIKTVLKPSGLLILSTPYISDPSFVGKPDARGHHVAFDFIRLQMEISKWFINCLSFIQAPHAASVKPRTVFDCHNILPIIKFKANRSVKAKDSITLICVASDSQIPFEIDLSENIDVRMYSDDDLSFFENPRIDICQIFLENRPEALYSTFTLMSGEPKIFILEAVVLNPTAPKPSVFFLHKIPEPIGQWLSDRLIQTAIKAFGEFGDMFGNTLRDIFW